MNKSETIRIPYAKGYMELTLDENRINGVLTSKAHEFVSNQTEEQIVLDALEHPIESKRLSELAKNSRRVLLITSDHTRPLPSKVTLPILLNELRSQNTDVEIKILIATGFHRPTTKEEMIYKFGSGIVNNEQIFNHNCNDADNLVYKGILPSGGELWLNSLIDWADLIVSEGFIEPHFFAGFSGGRKSILPGIASKSTVFSNHCSEFIASNYSRTGNLESNPIHADMLFAANAARLAFILNVVIDSNKKVIKAFAGHPEEAHKLGCEFVLQLSTVEAVNADIVITSNGGYPLDQNIYQSVKGMTAAEACVNDGGVIIIAAACSDGNGGEEFFRWFAHSSSPVEVADKIACISQDQTIADQWQAQILARVLMKCAVIVVTDMCDSSLITDMHMLHAETLEKAMEIADGLVGSDTGITVIPDGVAVIVK